MIADDDGRNIAAGLLNYSHQANVVPALVERSTAAALADIARHAVSRTEQHVDVKAILIAHLSIPLKSGACVTATGG